MHHPSAEPTPAHHHHHHHGHGTSNSRLLWVTLLNLSITLVQIVGGIASNSLALLSDAFHNLGDTSALFIAFVAGKISGRGPDERRTFGYKRVEILAALFNAAVLIAICVFLFIEAYKRLMAPEPIHSTLMLTVALFGLIANLISVLVLQRDRATNLNIRAAWLHLLGDTLSSVVVIAGGLIMWRLGIYWIDPLVSALVGLYIIWQAWQVVRETVDILMQAAPAGFDIPHIRTELEKIGSIADVHHVHLWQLDDSQIHFEAHLNLTHNMTVEEMMVVRRKAEVLLRDVFHIAHTTLQFGYGCCDDPR